MHSVVFSRSAVWTYRSRLSLSIACLFLLHDIAQTIWIVSSMQVIGFVSRTAPHIHQRGSCWCCWLASTSNHKLQGKESNTDTWATQAVTHCEHPALTRRIVQRFWALHRGKGPPWANCVFRYTKKCRMQSELMFRHYNRWVHGCVKYATTT